MVAAGDDRREFLVANEATGKRIDKVLAEVVGPPVSRATVQRWIAEGRVTIDGRRARAKDHVYEGQLVVYAAGPAPSSTAEPDASVAVDIVWQDEHLAVVNKPGGLVVHPARGHASGTLVNGLLAHAYFGRLSSDQRDPQGALRPGIVHRIDKGTSGLLVVAKNDQTREGLKAQFADHSIERKYWAVTLGVPAISRIDTSYGRHPTNRFKFTSTRPAARRAVTHIEVVEELGSTAVIHCRLETGRTHQIRVHLSEQGHAPLLGDPLYGGIRTVEPLATLAESLGRQALHAQVLGFTHPVTGERLRFEAELPAELSQLLSALRALHVRTD